MVNHVLTVRGRKASVTPRTLVQGTVGHDTLTLDLDSEWSGLNVTVTFVAATTEVTPVLNANMCEIPHEVLVDSGEVDVFVLGTRDGKAMRHASLAHKMVVKKSNMSDGSTTADPSISAYRQAYDDAVKATEAANSADGEAGSTAAEMATLNKRYAAQIEQQASDFSTAQTGRSNEFDQAMQGYENAFNEAEGESSRRDRARESRGRARQGRREARPGFQDKARRACTGKDKCRNRNWRSEYSKGRSEESCKVCYRCRNVRGQINRRVQCGNRSGKGCAPARALYCKRANLPTNQERGNKWLTRTLMPRTMSW